MRRSLMPNLVAAAEFNARPRSAVASGCSRSATSSRPARRRRSKRWPWSPAARVGGPAGTATPALDLFDAQGGRRGALRGARRRAAVAAAPRAARAWSPGTGAEWLDADGAAVGWFGRLEATDDAVRRSSPASCALDRAARRRAAPRRVEPPLAAAGHRGRPDPHPSRSTVAWAEIARGDRERSSEPTSRRLPAEGSLPGPRRARPARWRRRSPSTTTRGERTLTQDEVNERQTPRSPPSSSAASAWRAGGRSMSLEFLDAARGADRPGDRPAGGALGRAERRARASASPSSRRELASGRTPRRLPKKEREETEARAPGREARPRSPEPLRRSAAGPSGPLV